MLVTVYDKEGNAHDKESADARECVSEMGWTFEKVEEVEKVVEKNVKQSSFTQQAKQ